MQSHEQNYFTLIFKLEHAILHGPQMYVSAKPWQRIYLSYQMNLFAAFFRSPSYRQLGESYVYEQ